MPNLFSSHRECASVDVAVLVHVRDEFGWKHRGDLLHQLHFQYFEGIDLCRHILDSPPKPNRSTIHYHFIVDKENEQLSHCRTGGVISDEG